MPNSSPGPTNELLLEMERPNQGHRCTPQNTPCSADQMFTRRAPTDPGVRRVYTDTPIWAGIGTRLAGTPGPGHDACTPGPPGERSDRTRPAPVWAPPARAPPEKRHGS